MTEGLVGRFRFAGSDPCLIIAEAGVNHNGQLSNALSLIDEAVKAGANAVKFQSFSADELAAPQAEKATYQQHTTEASETQYEMLRRLQLSPKQHQLLLEHCTKQGIVFLSTPYDVKQLNMLIEMNVAAIKISSTDVTNLPFLHHAARCGRPVILSTGMSTLGEVEAAVNVLREGGGHDLVLLHCTSEYPAPIQESNLRAIQTLRQAFQCPVGFSDHTPGTRAAPWAVALGACVIEKHFTLDRGMPGPDHRASLEPDELAKMVQEIRQLEAAMGDGIKRITPSEQKNKTVVQKGLTARCELAKGQIIMEDDLACKRPPLGLPPGEMPKIIGKKTARHLAAGEPITHSAIQWE